MNILEKFEKTTNSVQDILTENINKEIGMITDFKNEFEKKDTNKISINQNLITKLDNFSKDINKLVNNLNSSLEDFKSFLLKKLKMLTIKSIDDFNKLKKEIENGEDEREIDKLKIKIKESINNNLSDYFEEISKIDYFRNIKSLEICKTKLGYNICPYIIFDNLTQLSLEGVGLVNKNFQEIILYLLKNRSVNNKGTDYIGKNLKSLSVKNNRISLISLNNKKGEKDTTNDFDKLEYLNLSRNNIFDYYHKDSEKTLFKNVKLLDLTCNNITSPKIVKNILDYYKSEAEKESLILLAQNIGLIKNREIRESYSDYLENKLNAFKPKQFNMNNMKSFIFEGLFIIKNKDENKNNQNVKSINNIGVKNDKTNKEKNNQNQQNEYLFRINLNKFKASLVELNLSFNNISDNDIELIFQNNKELDNLKKLDLSSNAISQEFFVNFNEKKYYENYPKLKILDLSCNPINFDENQIEEVFQKFLLNCKNLKFLKLKSTSIGNKINSFLKQKILKLSFENKGEKYDIKDITVNELVNLSENDESFFKKSKVSIVISRKTKQKYITLLNQHFPYILSKIKFEEEMNYIDETNEKIQINKI